MLETLSDDDYVNVVYVSITKPSTCWAPGDLFVLGVCGHDACWEKGLSDGVSDACATELRTQSRTVYLDKRYLDEETHKKTSRRSSHTHVPVRP